MYTFTKFKCVLHFTNKVAKTDNIKKGKFLVLHKVKDWTANGLDGILIKLCKIKVTWYTAAIQGSAINCSRWGKAREGKVEGSEGEGRKDEVREGEGREGIKMEDWGKGRWGKGKVREGKMREGEEREGKEMEEWVKGR